MKQTFRGAVLMKNPIVQCQLYFVLGATFANKNSCLVARIVSFDIVKSSNSIFLNPQFFLLTRMFTI